MLISECMALDSHIEIISMFTSEIILMFCKSILVIRNRILFIVYHKMDILTLFHLLTLHLLIGETYDLIYKTYTIYVYL